MYYWAFIGIETAMYQLWVPLIRCRVTHHVNTSGTPKSDEPDPKRAAVHAPVGKSLEAVTITNNTVAADCTALVRMWNGCELKHRRGESQAGKAPPGQLIYTDDTFDQRWRSNSVQMWQKSRIKEAWITAVCWDRELAGSGACNEQGADIRHCQCTANCPV